MLLHLETNKYELESEPLGGKEKCVDAALGEWPLAGRQVKMGRKLAVWLMRGLGKKWAQRDAGVQGGDQGRPQEPQL